MYTMDYGSLKADDKLILVCVAFTNCGFRGGWRHLHIRRGAHVYNFVCKK